MAALAAGDPPDLIFCSAAADTNNYVDMEVAVDLLPFIQDETIGIKDFDDYNPRVMEEAMQWDGNVPNLQNSRNNVL